MDQELKTRWVAALRSGEYQQGIGELTTVGDDGETAYCCLGVLKEIEPTIEVHHFRSDMYLDVNSCGIKETVQCKLANMNDGASDEKQHSFNEMADFIETADI